MEVWIFQLNTHQYALPTSEVRDVIESTNAAMLPFSPEYVDGLIIVSGEVSVQIDLSVMLEKSSPIPVGQGKLLILNHDKTLCSLHVNRMVNMAEISDDQVIEVSQNDFLEEMKDNQPPIDVDFLAGKFQWKNSSIWLLDASKMGIENLSPQGIPQGRGGLLAPEKTVSLTNSMVFAKDSTQIKQYKVLVTKVRDECYALPLENIMEVTEIEHLAKLPQSHREIAGMAMLRETPCLVLSLDALLFSEAEEITKTEEEPAFRNYIQSEQLIPVVHKNLPRLIVIASEEHKIGLIVDDIVGIRNYQQLDSQTKQNYNGYLKGYIIEQDSVPIALVDLEVLMNEQRFASFKNYFFESESIEQENLSSNKTSFLTFRIGNEICALPLKMVRKVGEYLSMKDIPQIDKHDSASEIKFEGMTQFQGDVLPVIDLRARMHKATEITPLTSYIIVQPSSEDEKNNSCWALVVDQVNRVVEIDQDRIDPASNVEDGFVSKIAKLNDRFISILSLDLLNKD